MLTGTNSSYTFHDLDAEPLRDSLPVIFASHFGHLAIIFLWASGTLFHVAWQGNFEQWILNPLKVTPIAHAIWDPHFGQAALRAYTPEGFAYPATLATSGVYHWWFTIGMRSNIDLYNGALGLLILACVFLYGGFIHTLPNYRPSVSWFNENESRLNHHLTGLFGVSSLAWTGHLVHVAIPESRGQHVRWENLTTTIPHPGGLTPFFNGNWGAYAEYPDTSSHIFGTAQGAGSAILTFLGGFHPQTQSLWLTDIAHHHLAISILFIFAGHMYRTNYGIGHSLNDILCAHSPPRRRLGDGHRGLFSTITYSLNFQLSLALAALGTATSLTAQHMYALPSYAFIASSHVTEACLYCHHQWIAGALMIGAFAHGAIFLVRDYEPKINRNNVLARVLDHKEAIISHLSWVSLFLGFHTLGIYVHNDTCSAFGLPENRILIEPIFAQYIQASSGKLIYGIDAFLSTTSAASSQRSLTSVACSQVWLPEWIEAINASNNFLFLPIGPGDLLVHHGIALGLHVTTLILTKGALDARGSSLMPDKVNFGYAFPCDGPGRGGTCDISAFDAFYLATFWYINTTSWTLFYWHWKALATWSGNAGAFDDASLGLMGWFNGYLWYQSANVIYGYSPDAATGVLTCNNNSVWAWMFLFGHLTWATGFMFLISWRGYWQELIETLIWAHERTPIANKALPLYTPSALSIVQGRYVGLTHFSVGSIITYAPFLIACT